MAKYTENIRLAQPEGSDYYDIEVFNHNSELIDKKIGEMDNSLATIKEGATREKAGIVQLGTEEGKALEGMMLVRLAGAYGYGGDIQDEGVKNPNYIYYDRNTRKMYKCLKQNQDISANVTNFIPLDNNSLLERLENLLTFKMVSQTIVSDKGTQGTFFFVVKGPLRIIYFMNVYVKNEYQTTFKLPDWFCLNTLSMVGSCGNGSGGVGGEVAEIHLDTSTQQLKMFPSIRAGFQGNLELTGQIVSINN